MWKKISKRTLFFTGFMIGFFMLLLFLTYYSRVTYFKNLPKVNVVMPERTENYGNGRYLYAIPKQAVQKEKDSGKFYIYTARTYRDILGERNLVTRIFIRIEENATDHMVVVDGIVREEPVITEGLEMLCEGQSVLLNAKE